MRNPKTTIAFLIDPTTKKLLIDVEGKFYNVPDGFIIKRKPDTPNDWVRRYDKLGIEEHIVIKDPTERRKVYQKNYRKLKRDDMNASTRRWQGSPRGIAMTRGYREANRDKIKEWKRKWYLKSKAKKNGGSNE